jgi:hypothetical protein
MANNQTIKVVPTEERSCENCGGVDLEVLWHYTHDAKTRGPIFQFDVRNAICRDCGFVFVSPVFLQSSLLDYYSNSYSAFAGQEPDYDIVKRTEFISEVAKGRDLLVEIGSNQQTRFHDHLRSAFKRIVTVELNDSVNCDSRSIDGLSINDADVVVHYFVLEHIPHVKAFLGECKRLLKSGGVMVCEVPDIAIYPIDPAGLELWEHTNHFSRAILDQMAAQCGFSPLASSHGLCSRSFGFVAAYLNTPADSGHVKTESCYDENKRFFLTGLKRMRALRDKVTSVWSVVRQYEVQGKQIVFWAANEMMAHFLQESTLPERVKIFDSNPAKTHYFDNLDVHLPEAASEFIRASDAIFIFSAPHAEAILADLLTVHNKTYSPEYIHIVDYESD